MTLNAVPVQPAAMYAAASSAVAWALFLSRWYGKLSSSDWMHVTDAGSNAICRPMSCALSVMLARRSSVYVPPPGRHRTGALAGPARMPAHVSKS